MGIFWSASLMISIVCTRTEIWLSFLVEARLTAVVAHGRQASSTSARWQPYHFPLSCYVFAHADIARRRRGWSARLVDTHTRTHRMHAYIHIYICPLLLFCNSTEQAEWAPRNVYVDAKVMKAIAGWKNALVLNCLMSSSLVQKLFWLWSTAMKPCCFWFGWCRANGFAISYWTDILSCKLAIFHPMGNIGRWWEAKAIASAVLLTHRG